MQAMFSGPARWRDFLTEAMEDGITDVVHQWPDLSSLSIPFHLIREHDAELADNLLEFPGTLLRDGTDVLRQLATERGSPAQPFLRVSELPQLQRRLVNAIRATDVNQLLALDGIVSRISGVRPRLYQAHWKCTRCGHITIIGQEDESQLEDPVECIQADGGCGRGKGKTTWVLLLEQSQLVNTQFVELQEPPELLRGGGQPERLRLLLEHDMAGMLNPGDRVVVNGVLFTRNQRRGGQRTPIFDLLLSVVSIERQSIPFEEVVISEEDLARIEAIRKREDLYTLMASSIAPSIHQELYIKESLLLQLFGGVSRRQSDGTRNRGDMHILLIGDPGVAKSQLLHYMSDLSPRGQFASGQSASKAGLTAAAIRDEMADGRFVLEAGALVLADMGLAAIDEMDKMVPEDRAAMHEALEQQSITVHKGGVNAKLRTRCAVLGAANPKSGRIIPADDMFDQINLPPPLFSRFDIIWLLEDQADEDRDHLISSRILQNRTRGTAELLIEQGRSPDPTKERTGGVNEGNGLIDGPDGSLIISRELFSKYVAHAKRGCHPTLDEAGRQAIQEYYLKVRAKGREMGGVGITPRALEALVRMSEASAKIRLSEVASLEDVKRACRIDALWRAGLSAVGIDEEAMHSGKSIEKRSKEQVVLHILEEQGGRQQPVEEVTLLNEAAKHGFESRAIEHTLQQMKQAGSIWSPRHGLYQLA